MTYLPLGINDENKKVFGPVDADTMINNVVKLEKVLAAKGIGVNLADEVNKGFDTNVRWTYLVHEDEPRIKEFKEILKPLALFRHMKIPDDPLRFYGQQPEWRGWLKKHLENISPMGRPNYILIVGDPEMIPFEFQSRLDVQANVGRVCFDTLEELQTYVDKVIKLSDNPPQLEKKATFFAPNFGKNENGEYDATHYSYNKMVKPMLDYIKKDLADLNIATDPLVENNATKEMLKDKLTKSKSAFVYVASHGAGRAKGADRQKEITGAIACQDWNEDPNDDSLFKGKDIPSDKETPFLEGAVFVQFSCFSYGTPKYDDVIDLSSNDSQPAQPIADKPLVADIPKKLLAHPRGPLAFIGHVNTAYLEGFYDDNVTLSDEDKLGLGPYNSIVDSVFNNQTMGTAMNTMNMRGADDARALADEIPVYIKEPSAKKKLEINKIFLSKHDSVNYFLFGDPAVRLNL
jgi:hypothetical protein